MRNVPFLQRVLTQEFIDGVKINDIDGMKELNLNLKDVSSLIIILGDCPFSERTMVLS